MSEALSTSGSGHAATGRDAREPLLADLNPAQREAVTHPGGPLLIVAGAGSGKTRVLTRRAGWLVAGGLPGPAVLAITFTNKAADVLRQRLADLPGGAGVWAGTFHGFCAWLLRRHGAAIALDERFTIADRDDQLRLLKTVLKEAEDAGGLDLSRFKPTALMAWISRRKNGDPAAPREWEHDREALAGLAEAYGARLRSASLLDFDDLLLEARRLLTSVPAVAAEVQARFAHVLVDEYQDTNRVQRDLLLALLGPGKNLTVVGDPDQSIYRWRGATVRNILEFGRDLPGATTVVLDRNYRSTARILAAAEAVIARNRERFDKRLVPHRPSGERVRVVRAADARDEAEVVADSVLHWQREHGSVGGVAVIYRVNALSRAVELALAARRVPYRVVAGVEFFQRQEVKDVLAYARLLQNPRDEAAFARVANVPRRGVGATSLGRVRALCASSGRTWTEVVRGEAPGVPKKALQALRAFADLLQRLSRMPRAPVRPLLEALIEESGYRAQLAGPEADPDGGRRENVQELLAAAHDYDEAHPDGALGGFLEQAGLVSDQDALEEGSERVSLLSAHAAKGLEFPCVIVIGAEQGLFPHARSVAEESGLEEERRLFYVAMTRAMERLVITHAAWRFGMSGLEPRLPSPFLRDIPAAAVEGEDRAGYGGARPWQPQDEALEEDGPGYARGADSLAPGARVRHAVFGEGLLVASRGAGPEQMLTIEFDLCGRKTLAVRYARLERL